MSKLTQLLRPVTPPTVETPRPTNPAVTPAAIQPQTQTRDGFSAGAPPPQHAARLGFGLPDLDLPDVDLPNVGFGLPRLPDIDLPDIDLPDIPSVDDIKDAFGNFLDGVKDRIIEHGADALFEALEALPGDIGNEELRALQDLGQVKAPERGLTSEERASLETIYGDSIDYDSVVVREGDIGLFNQDDRPLVLGNTILVPEGRLDDDGQISGDDLIHEAAHLWQFQHGGIDYIKESIQAQGQEGSGAYEFEDDVLAGKPWDELGPEQQAHLIETAYEQGYFDRPGRSFEINGQDATPYLQEALRQIRAGAGAPGGPPLVS